MCIGCLVKTKVDETTFHSLIIFVHSDTEVSNQAYTGFNKIDYTKRTITNCFSFPTFAFRGMVSRRKIYVPEGFIQNEPFD